MSQRINESFDVLRDEHNTRMKNVMADIRALSDSITVSAEHGAVSDEMQRLRHQVERYDQIFPIRQAQVKELEQMNKKLRADLLEEKYRNERMRARLDKAESLAISLGTPDLGKKRRAAGSLERDDERSEGATSSDDGEEESDGDEEEDGSSERSSSSSHSGEEGGEQEQQQQPDQVMEPAIDLSVSPTDPVEDGKETSAAPANRLSFKQALEISKKNRSQSAAVSTKAKTDPVPSHRKMITLSSLGTKRDDSANKRTRTALEPTNDQEQPVSKKPPQNNDREQPVSKKPPQNNDPTPNRQVGSEVAPRRRSRNLEKEESIQEEVKRSAQNVRWTKGPLPSNIDHWFYDLREAGTVPPPSLVAASRNMVLTWKAALGRQYFPYSANAGGSVMSLEHAYRSFKAVTLDMPLAGWTSRACAKHQSLHDTVLIPMLVAKDGNPLDSRPCPLIYYYEQLLADMRHIVTHLFEVIPRTILNPIPRLILLHLPGTSNQPPPIMPPLLLLIITLGDNPRAQKARRTYLRPMNIFRN